MARHAGEAHFPGWVPDAALHYLAHVEDGQSIRDLARRAGCHASTVLRQIRRIETRRDDVLVELALQRLGPQGRGAASMQQKVEVRMNVSNEVPWQGKDMMAGALSDDAFRQEAQKVLKGLMEKGAVLAVAMDMDVGVVVCDRPDGRSERLATVERAVAEAMALKEWIGCAQPGRVARYTITAAGRATLMQMTAQSETARFRGMNEAAVEFVPQGAMPMPIRVEDEVGKRTHRYGQVETPVAGLARRRDKEGEPFLDDSLVRAGERLREDYELALMGHLPVMNWDALLWGDGVRPAKKGAGAASGKAFDRVLVALRELGPGLGDVVLLCCCQLEGIETAEKRMGWAARSGKVVLRIALERLKRHYAGLGREASLIG